MCSSLFINSLCVLCCVSSKRLWAVHVLMYLPVLAALGLFRYDFQLIPEGTGPHTSPIQYLLIAKVILASEIPHGDPINAICQSNIVSTFKMIKYMSTISKDVTFFGKKKPVGRSTTSSRACNQAQTIQSCQHINLLPLTASRQEYFTYLLPLTASPYYKYHWTKV